ncbi:MAG: glycosyltransferase family 4 protein [Candidatus Cloacimonadales bacterium]
MRIFLASYDTVMLNKSGPSYKLIHTQKALADLGIEAKFYDMWNPNITRDSHDLVHIFNASVSTYSLAANLLRFGVRYVVNPIFFSNHSAATIRLYRKLDNLHRKFFKLSRSDYDFTKFICEQAEMVLPNTEAERELLIKGLDISEKNNLTIHNGVEARFAEADPSLFSKKYGCKDFVLNVGHLGSPRKNGYNMIKALAQVDAPVFIIANVFANAEGQRCVDEIEKSKNITLIRWVEHDDPLLASAYAACKVFALPTRYETPGRAALEAGLAQANIVITPNGGTKEYFGDFADYIDPDSIQSIRKAVEKSLNKPQTDQLQKHIQQNYIWPVIAQQTVKIYNKLK